MPAISVENVSLASDTCRQSQPSGQQRGPAFLHCKTCMEVLSTNAYIRITAHLLVLLAAFLSVQHLKFLRQSAALRLLPSSLRTLSAACCGALLGSLCGSVPLSIRLPNGRWGCRACTRLLRCP